MNVLGISGLPTSISFKKEHFPELEPRYYRVVQGLDSAAALVSPQGVLAAAAEERFRREKGTGAFPRGAIDYCLRSASLHPRDITHIAHGFCYEPYRQLFKRIALEEERFAKVYSPTIIRQELEKHYSASFLNEKLVSVPHHLAHAASTFYLSGFNKALVFVSDGMGEMHSSLVALADESGIKPLAQVPTLNSLGILYGIVTLHLGFWMGFDEYKVMGLAPYGNPRRYFQNFMDLIKLRGDGTFRIPFLFTNQTARERETYEVSRRFLTEKFGPARPPGTEISQRHKDIAAGLQAALQSVLLHLLDFFQEQSQEENLCLAGGVALNCVANGVIRRSGLFRRIFIQPAAGDDGTALGAALYVLHSRHPEISIPPMTLPLWGPDYDDTEVERCLRETPGITVCCPQSLDDLVQLCAERLDHGQILGWFQGRMEFGPRALGSRSILADPRVPDMRERINHRVKKREEFRPFAPAVPYEDAARIFEIEPGEEDVFTTMLFVTQVREFYRRQLPSITHVDGSARVQTVSHVDHNTFWSLLTAFGRKTGVPVLLNTSFNVKEEPIVCSPRDALATFRTANLDALAIGKYLVWNSN